MITTTRFSIFGFQNLSDFVYSVFLYELSISEDRELENRLFPHTDLILYDHKTKLLQIMCTISRPQLFLSVVVHAKVHHSRFSLEPTSTNKRRISKFFLFSSVCQRLYEKGTDD